MAFQVSKQPQHKSEKRTAKQGRFFSFCDGVGSQDTCCLLCRGVSASIPPFLEPPNDKADPCEKYKSQNTWASDTQGTLLLFRFSCLIFAISGIIFLLSCIIISSYHTKNKIVMKFSHIDTIVFPL